MATVFSHSSYDYVSQLPFFVKMIIARLGGEVRRAFFAAMGGLFIIGALLLVVPFVAELKTTLRSWL